jgi:hypothetical protein
MPLKLAQLARAGHSWRDTSGPVGRVLGLVVDRVTLRVKKVPAGGSGPAHAKGRDTGRRHRESFWGGAGKTAGGQDGTFVAVPARQVAHEAPLPDRARPTPPAQRPQAVGLPLPQAKSLRPRTSLSCPSQPPRRRSRAGKGRWQKHSFALARRPPTGPGDRVVLPPGYGHSLFLSSWQ